MKVQELLNEVITDMHLSTAQKAMVAQRIEDLLRDEGVDANGVEVSYVQRESDGDGKIMKALFTYEIRNREAHDTMYFTAYITDTEVSNFVEVKFDREGKRIK